MGRARLRKLKIGKFNFEIYSDLVFAVALLWTQVYSLSYNKQIAADGELSHYGFNVNIAETME